MTDAEVLERETAVTFDLAASPSHLIHRAQQFAADRFAEEMGPGAITQRQFAVLTAVAANEGLTQTDLVRATGIDRSTLAELVARMAARKLLLRERARTDARANTVRLTPEGKSVLDGATALVARADAAILAAMPKAKRAAFVDMLQRIAQALDAPDEAAAEPEKLKKPKKDKKPKKPKEKPKDTEAKSKAPPKKAAGKKAKKSA